jgi:proline dehydrogenase
MGRGGHSLVDGLRRRRIAAYGAGQSLDTAIDACRRLTRYGMTSTVGYSAPAGDPPRAVADVHLAAFDRLSRERLDCQVSIKLSALDFDAALLQELAAAARASGHPLHIDALAPDTVDPTWKLVEGLPSGADVGITLPGRWRRSVGDVAVAKRLGLRVRVVKGQWADDAPGPAIDPAEGFLRVVDELGGHGRTVAVATHDVQLLGVSLQRLAASGTPASSELLFGLPFRGPLLTARRLGVPVRGYVPFGHRGATYGIADLPHRPAATRWLLQDLVLGQEKTWRSLERTDRPA